MTGNIVVMEWGIISTAVVGLAGIGATLWQAQRATKAEDRRIREAEKRRVYVKCLVALEEMYRHARGCRYWQSQDNGRQFEDALSAEDDSRHAMAHAANEAKLIAPSQVNNLMDDNVRVLENFVHETHVKKVPYSEADPVFMELRHLRAKALRKYVR